MEYFHVSTTDRDGLVHYAILVWGLDPALPNIRLVPSKNAQTQMLAAHVPAAIDRLLKDGHQSLRVEAHQ